MNKTTRSGIATLAVLSLIWGYTWIVQKEGLRFASPLDYGALRALPGALVLFSAMIVLRRPLRPTRPGYALLLGLFQTTAFIGFTNWALLAGGAGRSAILCYTMPFWTLLLARVVLGERLRALQWCAVALAGLGLVLVLEPWHLAGTIASKVLAVAGGVSWAASAVVAKYWRAREDYDLLSATAWQMLLGGLVLAAIAWFVPSHPIHWTPYFGFLLGYMVVLSTAVGWFLWMYLLNRLPAGIAGLSMMAVPVLGVFFSWLQIGEQPSRVELVGIVVIAISLALLAWAGQRNQPADAGTPAVGE
ncbi:MAG: Permease of the drug/metabolite transporter (DMT) superfamily [Burkholderiaceae bacterium]|nr:MAG: Permease of the drug/metabolite transporter (DMT) superfamily [Burkholderiaceae bacterium]